MSTSELIPDFAYDFSTMSTNPYAEGYQANTSKRINGDNNSGSSFSYTNESRRKSDEIQSDKFNLVYIATFMLGISMLLPWNVFITANNYWMHKFRDVNDPVTDPAHQKTTELQKTFTSYLSIAFNFPYIVCMILATIYSHKINHLVSNGISIFGVLLSFVVVTALVPVDSDKWQNKFLAITMIQVVIISIFNGLIQTGITGLIAILPPKFMYATMNGQAIAGIFTSIVMILILIGNSSPIESALIYFISAIVTLIIGAVSYFGMHQSAFFQYHYHLSLSPQKQSQASQKGGEEPVTKTHSNSTVALIKILWKYIVSILLIFWVTIGVFPAVTVLAKSMSESSGSKITGDLFNPIACFLLFNLGDLVGRVICTWIPIPAGKPNLIIFLSAARAAFIPLFMLCNNKGHLYLPVVFNSDAYYIGFMVVFAVSNGYLVTNIMMQGPKNVGPELQQKAGSLLITCLGMGITIGSFSSLLFVKLL